MKLTASTRIETQNVSFAPSCIVRGSRTVLIVPNVLPRFWIARLVIPLKFVLLKTLKTSPRSCSFHVSPKRKFLKVEKSTRLVGGPSIVPRPALPTTFGKPVPVVGLIWKHTEPGVLAIHDSNVCGALAFGSQTTLGRFPAIRAGTFPKPAASKLVVAVNGKPLCNVTMPENCQPPRICPLRSLWFLKNGSS